jgi:hypothetical protein
MTLLAIAFLAMGTLDATAGPIYKWVDKNGVVTFGSQPPESTPAQPVAIDTYVPPTPPTTNKATDGKTDKKKVAKAKKPTEPEIPPAEKRRLCEQARNDLAIIQAHGQIRQKDANGNVSYLSDEEKQNRTNAANRDIQQYCR